MLTILGIDPGSAVTGYGIIKSNGKQHQYITSGCIKIKSKDWGERLRTIYEQLRELILLHHPDEVSIEEVFIHRNPGGALKLGQARGAAMVAVAIDGIPIAEYSAREVKQSVVGYGAAKKEQVQFMISRLLNVSEQLAPDAADALAIALCHAHSRNVIMQQKEQL